MSTVLTHPEITRTQESVREIAIADGENPITLLPSSTSVARWRRRVFPTKGQAGPRPEK